MSFKIKDLNLAEHGRLQVEWAEKHMPVLMRIRERFSREKPLSGVRISACLHVTKETAVLAKTLSAGGAELYLAANNPLSTQDEVAAALVEEGVHVYAWRGESVEEYHWALEKIAEANPEIVLDDGGDLHALIHKKGGKTLERVIGGTEETTTGIIRLKAMEKQGVLKYPVIAVNNAYTKYLFDNRYGTGQSTIDGILRATNILLAGKKVVVAGYGWVGRGIAMRARGMGAHVIIVEVDPVRALEAVMDGFEVMRMTDAARIGDIFITATGNLHVIDEEHLKKLKDGAILANSGHFNVEINIEALEKMARSKKKIRPYLEEYTLEDGRKIYLLAEGRLVNLVAAEGHPSEVMDMSFSNQALSVETLINSKLPPKVHNVPLEQDNEIARLKLETLGVEIDSLKQKQVEYLKSWELGT